MDKGLTQDHSIKVMTQGGLLTLDLQSNGEVTVRMGIVNFKPEHIPFTAEIESSFYDLDVAGGTYKVGSASIGNPHVLLQVDDIDQADVEGLGPLIERHERFPNRVNVGFMKIIDRKRIYLRVFERGVGETRACGTGACAAVAIGHRQGLLDKTVTVTLLGGDLLVHWPNENTSIEMTGPCSTVFEAHTRM